MSILDVAETELFDELIEDITLKSVTADDSADLGEVDETESAGTAQKAAEFPMNAEDMAKFDSGFFDSQDRVFKTRTDIGAKKKDIIVAANGKRYQVEMVEDRIFEGGFIDIFSKLEPSQVTP